MDLERVVRAPRGGPAVGVEPVKHLIPGDAVERRRAERGQEFADKGGAGSGIFPNSVLGQDYLSAEIDANVVNPCMLVHIRADETFSKLREEDALALL